jgi:hypothetical protein
MVGQDNGPPAESLTDITPQGECSFAGHSGADGAMDNAINAAISSVSAPGQEPPSNEIIAEARTRATDILQNLSGGEREGLNDLQNLTLSMGLPAARATFQFMIAAANLRGAAKKDALCAVAEFSAVTEVGCIKVDFFNQTSGKHDIAYLVLDKCPRDHNLGVQLDNLKVHVSDDKWPEVIRSISMLIHIGRVVYGQVARNNLDLIRRIHGYTPDDPCTKYLDLLVDRENTTLFLEPSWPSRIGIFIRLNADVQAELLK